jgi:hypothetical protein
LRPEAVPDLAALQQAARSAGVDAAVKSGFLRPTQAEAAQALPIAWVQPCAPEQQPPLTADSSVADEPKTGLQRWLGTVVEFSNADAQADRWLLEHAPDFGFVPSLPEAHTSGPREPSTWRWVGRPMAARVRPALKQTDYPTRLKNELDRALAELNAPEPTIWGQSNQCWAIPSATGRGCSARWYFLPLAGF